MKRIVEFTQDAAGWMFLCGLVLGLIVFAAMVTLLEFQKYRNRNK